MKTTENRLGDDPVAFANPMAGQYGREVGRIRNAGAETGVRAPVIVMREPLLEDASEVGLVERNHPVEAFAPNRANDSFAEGVRLRRSQRCLEDRETHRRDGSIDLL